MVISSRPHIEKAAAKKGAETVILLKKIVVFTPYNFHSKNLTAYGGLLP